MNFFFDSLKKTISIYKKKRGNKNIRHFNVFEGKLFYRPINTLNLNKFGSNNGEYSTQGGQIIVKKDKKHINY